MQLIKENREKSRLINLETFTQNYLKKEEISFHIQSNAYL